jgi:hypothetical protein
MAAKAIHYLAVFDDHTSRPLHLSFGGNSAADVAHDDCLTELES